MKTSYKEMLERARSQLPQEVSEHKRFEIPRVRSSTIGMRTVIHNFGEICNMLNREQDHLLKFLTREMATKASLEGGRAIFKGKFRNDIIDHLIKRYFEEFVVCPVCKRPDTKIVKEKRFAFLVCEACGAKSSTRPIK
jgi:translation initiation factor 2 subunit 2